MGSKQPALMDREREIALALSACPSFVMSKSAVYVLEKSEARMASQLSFSTRCPPRRSHVAWTRRARERTCRRILKVAELRAQGKSRVEIQFFVADAFAKGIFQPQPAYPPRPSRARLS